MSQQTVNTSTATDTLASGFDKVNDNFNELYPTKMSFDTEWEANEFVGVKQSPIPDYTGYLGVGVPSGTDTIDINNFNIFFLILQQQVYFLTNKVCALQYALANKLLPNVG